MWKIRLLCALLAVLSSGLIVGGILDAHHRDSGNRVSAKVTDCHLETLNAQSHDVVCDGTWVSGGPLLTTGHVVIGTVDGATRDDIGRTLKARAHGDHAYLPGHRVDIILIVLGAFMVLTFVYAGATASEDRARRRQERALTWTPATTPRGATAGVAFAIGILGTAAATVASVVIAGGHHDPRARPSAAVARRPIPALPLRSRARVTITAFGSAQPRNLPLFVTVNGLRHGRAGSAAGHHPFSTPTGVSLRTATPYFVDATFDNPGPGEIPTSASAVAGLEVTDSAGKHLPGVILVSDLPSCRDAIQRLTHPGDHFRTCAVFLLPPHQSVTAVDWPTPAPGERGARWTP